MCLNKIYNPEKIEKILYKFWEKKNLFKTNNIKKNCYCIIMPPPNITGNLHIGHALQQTIMDILIRYHRMQGKNTLWQPGIDHAGIATQILIENQISKEQKKIKKNFNKKLLEKIWKWKQKSKFTIVKQMKRLGNSIDWKKERFTMDKKSSHAVKTAFIKLYTKNLIYRGKKIINWDPKLKTVISDLETKHKKIKNKLWYIKYALQKGTFTKDGLDYLIITTTRPETMFGDSGIAINPEDIRYKSLIGKFALLPIIGRLIPIIEDKHTNMNKGTGCVKITPAHDFNDYDIGKNHNLPIINILTKNGKIREKAEIFCEKKTSKYNYNEKTLSYKIPKIFHGLDVFSARKLIIKELKNLGLILKEEPHNTTIPYNNRTNTYIEPMITNQWYIRTSPLAKIAKKVVKEKKIQFIPKNYKTIYLNWINNIQDWCISRQLLWGHRIPVWYDDKNKAYVGYTKKHIKEKYNLKKNIVLRQDHDVLDTWFSSGLWTFSSLGWPKQTKTLKTFHPTNVIISGFDIIFFWIARMIMLTTHFIKNKHGEPEIPFKTVYITGLVRDEKGKKMSKSKGNTIDPIDIIDGISLHELIKKRKKNSLQPEISNKIEKSTKKQFPNGIKPYGADTLRLTLTSLSTINHDIHLDIKRLEGYRNFCNKLWNASRFVLINTKNQDCGFGKEKKKFSLPDKWILIKLNKLIKSFRYSLDNYRFDIATNILYEFIWNQFCDWYLELTKITIKKGTEIELRGTRHILITTLEKILRLSHPIIPFITEKIWKKTRKICKIPEETIMLQSFPKFHKNEKYISDFQDIEWAKKIITTIRKTRSEMNIPYKKSLQIFLKNTDNKNNETEKKIKNSITYITSLATLKKISILKQNEKTPELSISKIIKKTELFIPIKNITNKEIDLKNITKKIKNAENMINKISKKLKTNFIKKAPKPIVEQEQKKLKLYKKQKENFIQQKTTLLNL
ncbi:MAG: valine--tRNA ligase [Candidatus Westeberhardia cardiocondylae]|nr:valine--tRNA ligase [Candidatus Westeberhardia cardiocondylae]